MLADFVKKCWWIVAHLARFWEIVPDFFQISAGAVPFDGAELLQILIRLHRGQGEEKQ